MDEFNRNMGIQFFPLPYPLPFKSNAFDFVPIIVMALVLWYNTCELNSVWYLNLLSMIFYFKQYLGEWRLHMQFIVVTLNRAVNGNAKRHFLDLLCGQYTICHCLIRSICLLTKDHTTSFVWPRRAFKGKQVFFNYL